VDVKRDATLYGLFRAVRDVAGEFAKTYDLRIQDWSNNDPNLGDTCYLGSRHSQVLVRIYQPGLKLAQMEGRTGDDIHPDEANAVRVELEFKPQKQLAKQAASRLTPDELWGVSPWVADFAREVFAMDVRSVSISDRRESNRNRALRAMAGQYRAHLGSLHMECDGDVALFGSTILDLADIPHLQ
jgi:hypothetical protein